MDLTAIGVWAGEHGPYLGVIILLSSLLWKFANRLLAQQDLVLKAMDVAATAVETTEKLSDRKD